MWSPDIINILRNFKEKTAVSIATVIRDDGSIISSYKNNSSIDEREYNKGISNAWKVINKLAKDKSNRFNFYKNIEKLSFQLDERFNNISYGVLIKAITDKAILLMIFPEISDGSFIFTEFKRMLNKLSSYFLDFHDHLYL